MPGIWAWRQDIGGLCGLEEWDEWGQRANLGGLKESCPALG